MKYMHRDWNEVWKKAMEQYLMSLGRSQEGYWDATRAERFNRESQHNDWAKGRTIIREMSVLPTDNVLDIGAGPGSVAIPLAPYVAHITAVEPNIHMCALLEQNIRAYNVQSFSIVRKLWDDVVPGVDLSPPYDVVLASFSLGMLDLRAALRKMTDVSSREVYVFWFSGTGGSDRDRQFVQEQILGRPYHPAPTADIVYNVLCDMEIFPDVVSRSLSKERIFPSMREAEDYFLDRYGLDRGSYGDAVRRYLDTRLVSHEGLLALRESHVRTMLTWKGGA